MIAVSLLLAGGNGEKHENLQILAIAFFNGYGNNFSWRGDSG